MKMTVAHFNLAFIVYMATDNAENWMLLLCSHSPNDVPPVPQRNVSIAAVRGAVRSSKENWMLICDSFSNISIKYHCYSN